MPYYTAVVSVAGAYFAIGALREDPAVCVCEGESGAGACGADWCVAGSTVGLRIASVRCAGSYAYIHHNVGTAYLLRARVL